MNRDIQSSAHFLSILPIESVVTVGNNLITNGTFDTNGNGWSTWQGHVNLSVGQNPTFGSSVLTFTGNIGGAQNYANLQSPNFSVDNGAKYLLRFKGSSTNHHVVGVQNAMAESPWSNIALGRNLVLDENVRNYQYLFTPTQNQNPARIGFVQNVPGTAYLDDFSLFKYTSIVYENAKQRSPLFINPTATATNVNLIGSYRDLQNNIVSGTVVLAPWSSIILVRTEAVLTNAEQISTSKNITLYPNPATSFLKITGIENQVKINIFTITGAMILTTEYEKNQQINFDLAQGIYIVEIIDGNMKTSKKLIVE